MLCERFLKLLGRRFVCFFFFKFRFFQELGVWSYEERVVSARVETVQFAESRQSSTLRPLLPLSRPEGVPRAPPLPGDPGQPRICFRHPSSVGISSGFLWAESYSGSAVASVTPCDYFCASSTRWQRGAGSCPSDDGTAMRPFVR